MARFVPISIEVNDSKATPRVRGIRNAFDDLDKSGSKTASGGLKNVFDSTTKLDSLFRHSDSVILKNAQSLKQLGESATDTSKTTGKAFNEIRTQAESTARDSSGSFTKYFNAALLATFFQQMLSQLVQFGKEFVSKSVELAQDAKNALLGVQSVSLFKGINPQEAQDAINSLALVKNGIIGVSDASVALKNLLQSGFGLQQSITLIERFGDTAAFGKQAALSYGEAIRSATEGIKNQNSILVDNAGISKNIEVLLKERGFHMQDLSDKVKGAAARQALYNGLLAESAGQLGDAAKLTETYTGVIAAQDKAYQDLQRSIGDIIITNPALIESNKIVAEQLSDTTTEIQKQDSESAKFVRNAISYYASLKAQIAPFGAFVLNAVKAVASGTVHLFSGFGFAISKISETLINSVAGTVRQLLAVYAAFVNSIIDTAKTLPPAVLGPLAWLQQQQHVKVPEFVPNSTVSDYFRKTLEESARDLKQAGEAMVRASDEGVEVSRRLKWEETSAANRREFNSRARSLGYDPDDIGRRSQGRLDGANELADGAAGGGKGKRISDDFKSIANVVPVPTPADPQLKAMIEEYAATFGIPLWVAFAQIWAESKFNKNAMSPKQAKGLTQITPGTAAQYNIPFKNLNDPAVALSGWGKIMSSLYTKYGSWDLALLAYHQGEKPVDRLVEIIQRGEVNEAKGGFAAAAKRAGIGPAGRKYLEDINLFKSNPIPEQESPFLGMKPQEIVKAVLTTDARGNPREITTDSAPVGQLPVKLEREWDKFYSDSDERARALKERRESLDAEYYVSFKNLMTDIGNAELDLQQLRRENADDQFTEQRRLLRSKSEERDLLLGIRDIQDELATGPYNESLRVQLALLQDIADIRRRDEDAIKSENRARLELADAEVFHAQQARAIVLDHLAQSRSETEVFADAIIDSYDAINDVVLRGVEKLTGGIRIVDNLIAGLITRLTNRLFQKLLDMLLPPGTGGASAGGGILPGAGGAGGLRSLFGLFQPGGNAALTGGYAGGPGAAQYLGLSGLGGLGGGSLTPPTSLTQQLAQQASLTNALHEAGHGDLLGLGAGGGTTAVAGSAISPLAGLAPLFPFLGAGLGAQLGSGSKLGMALGIAGGGLAGLLGIAMAPTAIGGLGAGIAGLSTLGLIAGPAAIALIAGAIILSKNAARRRDEKSRNQSMLDSLGQLNQILSAVKSDRMDGGQAIAAAVQVRSQYVASMGDLKDKKTREIAMKDVYRLDLIIGQIRTEADRQLKRKQTDQKLVPEFNTGGLFRSDFYLPERARSALELPRAERGLFELPGSFDRRDDLLMRVSHGETVAVMTPQQYARIGGRKTFAEAGVPALAGGGYLAPQPDSESSMPPINLSLNMDLPGYSPGLLVEQIFKTPEGYELFVRLWNKAKRESRGNVR